MRLTGSLYVIAYAQLNYLNSLCFRINSHEVALSVESALRFNKVSLFDHLITIFFSNIYDMICQHIISILFVGVIINTERSEPDLNDVIILRNFWLLVGDVIISIR